MAQELRPLHLWGSGDSEVPASWGQPGAVFIITAIWVVNREWRSLSLSSLLVTLLFKLIKISLRMEIVSCSVFFFKFI